MLVRKKKRDVKFIIYQSLYILVISSLAMNHMTLSSLPYYVKPGETDTLIQKPEDGMKIELLSKSDTIVSSTLVSQLEKKIDSLEKVNTGVKIIDRTRYPTLRTEEPKPEPPVIPKIRGGEKK